MVVIIPSSYCLCDSASQASHCALVLLVSKTTVRRENRMKITQTLFQMVQLEVKEKNKMARNVWEGGEKRAADQY